MIEIHAFVHLGDETAGLFINLISQVELMVYPEEAALLQTTPPEIYV